MNCTFQTLLLIATYKSVLTLHIPPLYTVIHFYAFNFIMLTHLQQEHGESSLRLADICCCQKISGGDVELLHNQGCQQPFAYICWRTSCHSWPSLEVLCSTLAARWCRNMQWPLKETVNGASSIHCSWLMKGSLQALFPGCCRRCRYHICSAYQMCSGSVTLTNDVTHWPYGNPRGHFTRSNSECIETPDSM